MYSWIWRHLPGPVPVRALLAVALLAAIVVLLFTVVFPQVEAWLELNEVTVEE
jgi:hypothetical protein